VRLANVVLSGPDEEAVASAAEAGSRWVRRWLARGGSRVEVVGPAPAPIERLHGRWRWHFLLRASSPAALGETARALAHGFTPKGADLRLVLDRDPVALL
jgi:primosomal protein N' (replication factor Y)